MVLAPSVLARADVPAIAMEVREVEVAPFRMRFKGPIKIQLAHTTPITEEVTTLLAGFSTGRALLQNRDDLFVREATLAHRSSESKDRQE